MSTSRREFLATSGAASACVLAGRPGAGEERSPALSLGNGKLATLDTERPFAEAVAIEGGRFTRVGSTSEVMAEKGAATRVMDLGGRTAIPGLNDSHIHPIRGGLNYNLELRWDGVPSLSDAMALLKDRASKTPPPHWVRVVGGWSEFQFKERRMPTLAETNAVAADTPVLRLHLHARP